MHLVIISCTPRPVKNSNTAKIIEQFRTGFEKNGNTTETHYLSKRNTWEDIRRAFEQNTQILFAMPLFVESIPGILVEFLDTLEPKSGSEKTRLSFLLQGGFSEAAQLRCGERYLEMLPGYLGCEYAGTLIKGNMFAVSMIEGKARESLIAPFEKMGGYFAEHGSFDKAAVSEFAKPEQFSKGSILFLTAIKPLQDAMFRSISKKLGCKEPLAAKPYEKYVK